MKSTNHSERFVSIADIPSLDERDENDRLTWDFTLPPSIDSERITVDMKMLSLIQNIGAMRSSHVLQYDGESTSFTPDINGMNMDGTASTALTGQMNQVPTEKSNLSDDAPDHPKLMQDYFKTRTTHQLNKTEIVSQVADEISKRQNRSHGELDREAAWAKVLDDTFNQSIRSASKAHLMNRTNSLAKAVHTGIYGYWSVDMGIDIANANIDRISSDIMVIGLIGVILAGADSLVMKKRHGDAHLQDRRWSLAVYGSMQPDRYFAINALSRTIPLISVKK